MRLNDLIDKTLTILQVRGYTKGTWEQFRNGRFSSLRQYYEEHSIEDFDVDITEKYIANIAKQYEKGNCSYSRYRRLTKLATWLISVYRDGALPTVDCRKSKIRVNDYFASIHQHYVTKMQQVKKPSSIYRDKSVALHFMDYLQKEKCYEDFTALSLKDIQDFILFSSQRVNGRIDGIIYITKCFLIYLKENEIINADLTPALYLKPPIRRRLLSGFTCDEADVIIAQPDRDSPIGKRDYAILLLVRNTGLRIGDVVKLKLTDINWKQATVTIKQSKTGYLLVLPLEADIEQVLIDYIRNGRPKSKLPYLFLRHNAPHKELSSLSLTSIFSKYRTKAEVPHTAGDGKSFHGFRRSIASWMLETGTPLTTISQILGHRSMDSAKPYLSFDEKNLRRCALSLAGIEISKEGLR